MAITQAVVAVGTTAVVAYNAGDQPARIMLHNESANLVHYGGAGVTTATGIPLAAGATSPTIETRGSDDDLYLIAGVAGPSNVRVLRIA